MNPFSASLINKIRFLGIFLTILMLLIFFASYKAYTLYAKKINLHHAIEISELLMLEDETKLENYLYINNIEAIDSKYMQKKLISEKSLISDNFIKKVFVKSGIELYIINDNVFFVLKNKNNTFYFRNNKSFMSTIMLPLGISGILFILLLYGTYYYIRTALLPLIRLNESIEHFAKAEEIDVTYEDAKDEIANVANAFYSAIEDNKKLKSQKNMYICTIMHEINTPLTKAKFLTHFMENEEEKNKFNALFNSMQDELNKLHEFENINNKMLEMKKEPYSLNALVADVCDVLLLDKKDIEIVEDQVETIFDYTLFIVVVKNLIDNAIKYSKNSKAKIIINKKYIEVQNISIESSVLDINTLTEAFKQGNECSNGMGLGLYLINEIVSKHNFKLEYDFFDNTHSFKVVF